MLEGSRRIRDVPITGLTAFRRAMCCRTKGSQPPAERGDSLTGDYLKADDNKIDELYKRLKDSPRVARVSIKKCRSELRDTVMENMLKMQFFNVIFACIIAFGWSNTARIALSERS